MSEESISSAPDIVRRVAADFPRDDASAVLAILEEYRWNERRRVARSALHLAEGNLERLRHYVAMANIDYRDVILWAEYDRSDRRVRDFIAPLSND